MNLYANGCSFVMGQELVDNDPLNMDNKRTAWPAQIGAYNDAWSGSGNHAIANRTMDYCRNNKVDIAIIGWSHYGRILTFGNNERNDRLGQFTIKPNTAPEIWEEHYHNFDMLLKNTQNVIESLYYWLKAHDIIPIFFNSWVTDYPCNVPMLWDGESWMLKYNAELGLPFKEGRHPDQKQHDWIANYLKEYIDDIVKSKTS